MDNLRSVVEPPRQNSSRPPHCWISVFRHPGSIPPVALPPLGPQSGGLPPLGPPPGAYGAPAGTPPFVGPPGGAGYAQTGAGAPGYPLQGGFAQQTGGQLAAASGYAGLPPGGYAQGSYAGQSAGYGPYQSGVSVDITATRPRG